MPIGHTHVARGVRVVVHLRDGSKVIARYGEHHDRHITFLDHPPIPLRKIRAVSRYHAPPS